ncbi:tyrosine-type recombinase/integrase [Mycobacterium gastri]|uniref:Integrase n=1 Tax=Mycobacterium gastri TaxID=1777 RepID=A0A1X1V563_MYCGS|nr:tyrosine-type recombinase/integrase [Mycobacterium gastri]ETW21439.1 integrase [Mycobacterium gastri 'Wayne']ORV64203.1 integrase [Mycobacterium gastri]
MIGDESERDPAALAVARVGRLEATGSPWEPYRVIDPTGEVIGPVGEFLKELQASGRSEATQRSYGHDLLRWFRFLWAVQVPWDQATRVEARDFCRWVQTGSKPASVRWKQSDALPAVSGGKYAPTTAAHGETVLRAFYDFHVDTGAGPMVNPFPLVRERRRKRVGAHHNPMHPRRNERVGLYRPKLVERPPRCIPDERFNELFAGLGSHRDRALVAFFVSTGARASELLGGCCGDVDTGSQLITVIRKGSRVAQQLPASPDAFVWLRLYQAEFHGRVRTGRDDPLWWTLRRPFRALTYHAARAMFIRVNSVLGTDYSIHDLRHTAAYRMARDPDMPLTDVQWILGHAQLTTTQIYTSAPVEETIASILAHHARRAAAPTTPAAITPEYRSDALDVLFPGASR